MHQCSTAFSYFLDSKSKLGSTFIVALKGFMTYCSFCWLLSVVWLEMSWGGGWCSKFSVNLFGVGGGFVFKVCLVGTRYLVGFSSWSIMCSL